MFPTAKAANMDIQKIAQTLCSLVIIPSSFSAADGGGGMEPARMKAVLTVAAFSQRLLEIEIRRVPSGHFRAPLHLPFLSALFCGEKGGGYGFDFGTDVERIAPSFPRLFHYLVGDGGHVRNQTTR
jgi:hypothetical protein